MMFAVPGSPGGYSPPPGADEQEEVEALIFEGSFSREASGEG